MLWSIKFTMPFKVRSYGKSQLWIKFFVCEITNLVIMDDSAHLIFLIMYVCMYLFKWAVLIYISFYIVEC